MLKIRSLGPKIGSPNHTTNRRVCHGRKMGTAPICVRGENNASSAISRRNLFQQRWHDEIRAIRPPKKIQCINVWGNQRKIRNFEHVGGLRNFSWPDSMSCQKINYLLPDGIYKKLDSGWR